MNSNTGTKRKILFITPGLKLRDGITANSINLINGWLESGLQVLVMNPGKFSLKVEGFFNSQLSFKGYMSGERAPTGPTEAEFAADTAVIQYAISTYWFRTYWIHKWLKSNSGQKVVLCCHEPVREIQLLGWLGKLIYVSAFNKSDKIVLFSGQAAAFVRTLTSKLVESYPLPVPVRNLSDGTKSDSPHFLMLGFYLKDKGFELGLNSFLSSLRENRSGITLSVIVSVRERVGSARVFSRRDKRDFMKFQNQLREAKNEFPSNIEIFGFLSIDEMQSEISKSDYLLMPYSNITNSGVAVTAKAHGIPVIASDLVPLVEAFGDIGIYFKAESSSGLTSTINSVASNPNWRIERDLRAEKMVRIASSETTAVVAVSISDTESS